MVFVYDSFLKNIILKITSGLLKDLIKFSEPSNYLFKLN